MRTAVFALLTASLLAACGPGGQIESGDSERADQPVSMAASENEATSPPAGNAPSDNRSRFTSIEDSRCRLLEENVEEGGYWRRLCPGHAGYTLERSESDLRQDLVVISPDGSRTQLRLSSIVARGAFNSLGDTVEWRGRDPADPEAMIVRMDVAHGSEPEKPDISNLVVVRLTGPVCPVAIVPPAPGQNESARTIADGVAVSCLEPERG